MTASAEASGGTMRAWRSTRPGLDGLVLDRVPRPSLGPRDALVAVRAAALNFSDILMLEDKYQIRPNRPFTPGQEISGVVVSAGAESGLRPGQHVASKVEYGGFAEYVLVRGDMAIVLPESTEPTIGAALSVSYTTAMVALDESTKLAAGETLLVHAAAGGVGLAAVEIGKALGARVIATAGGPEKCALARAHGAHMAVDYRDPNWVAAIRTETDGKGADVIFDPVGGEVTLQSLKCIAWGGRLLVVGFSSGTIPAIPANRLLLKRASAIGVYWSHDHDGPLLQRVTARLMALLAERRLSPHVDTRHRFEDLPAALGDLAARRSMGKLVLRFDESRGAL